LIITKKAGKFNYDSTLTLRGHTSNLIKNKADENILIVYGGVTGFNKYSDKFYEINLKVYFLFIFIKEKLI
jgi:hypothetical protein